MEDVANDREEEIWGDRPQRLARKWFWLPVLLGALIFLFAVTAWQFSAPGEFEAQFNALDDVDLEQSRLDTALPVPRGDLVIAQSFVPRHDGLEAIELMLAQYGSPDEVDNGLLTMQMFGPDGGLIAEEIVETREYDQNQVFRFSFLQQRNSRARTYTLKISGNAENNWSVWGYSLDVYEDGQLTLEAPPGTADPASTTARELRFTTRYHLTLHEALNAIGQSLYFEGLLFLLALATLPLPGCIALILFGRQQRAKQAAAEDSRPSWPWDPAAWWGVALALGVAIWPLLWLWLSLINGRWRGWTLWLVVVGGWAAFFWLWWQDKKARRRRIDLADSLATLPAHPPPTLAWNKAHLLLLLILLAGFAVRLLAVRDVFFPPWVDSSRHALITMIMTGSGQVIADYQPYLPVDHFPYHYGFHTLSGSLALMSGWPLPRLLLYLGQLLNALVPLTVYAALWLLTRRKGVGLIGAFFVAIPFFFPAYYATWGRFTQLTAVLLLPLAIALAWQLVRGEQFWQRVWWMLAILVAGLFLTHFRVFLYFLPFVLLVWLISLGRRTRPLAAAAGFGLIIDPAAPRPAPLGDKSGQADRPNDSQLQCLSQQLHQHGLGAGHCLRGRGWVVGCPGGGRSAQILGLAAAGPGRLGCGLVPLVISGARGFAGHFPGELEQHVHHPVCSPGALFGGCDRPHWVMAARTALAAPNSRLQCRWCLVSRSRAIWPPPANRYS